VWVVGSSGAWGWLDPRFFDDKRVVTMNSVGPTFGLSEDAVTVSQYAQNVDSIRSTGWKGLVVAPDRVLQGGMWGGPEFESDDLTIRDAPPPALDFVPFLKHWPEPGEERLFHGTTSLHMAMCCAWWMGASSVVTVAADHGWWRGQTNDPRYPTADRHQETDHLIRGHWREHTDELAAHLRRLGTNVYSLIPTVNLNLEGLSFECPRGRIG
jgi:hypothetical protein